MVATQVGKPRNPSLWRNRKIVAEDGESRRFKAIQGLDGNIRDRLPVDKIRKTALT